MRIISGGLRVDFLSYQKLLTAMFLQIQEISHASKPICKWIYIVKIVCDCFLP